jgi:hypothetical protein
MPDNQVGPTSKVEAVMARIRATLPGTVDRSPAGAGVSRAQTGEKNVFGEDVYRSLHQARTIGGGINVAYEVGWRTPIIGQIWMLVRRRIHQEIRIYIDTLTAQQSSLNTHFIRALTGVVESVDAFSLPTIRRQQQADTESLAVLRDEVSALRSEVQSLRRLLDGGTTYPANGDAAARE